MFEKEKSKIKYDLDEFIICFDSNVWLDMYKLPPAIIEDIIIAISNNVQYFWLPNQVYIEFTQNVIKNRDYTINRYKNIIENSCQQLNDAKNKINQELKNLYTSNILTNDYFNQKFLNEIDTLRSNFKSDLSILASEYEKDLKVISNDNDIISDLVEELNELRSEKPFSTKELLSLYVEGETRFKYKLPPGYTDEKKEKKNNQENSNDYLVKKYGDLIIWKEILRLMKNSEKNLLFVQNEKKTDWWESYKSKKINKFLVQEYSEVTNNKSKIYMVDFVEFLSLCGKEFGLEAETINDLVAKAKLEKDVLEYIEFNKLNILEEQLENKYLNDSNKLYDLLIDFSFFGGSVSDVECTELLNINMLNSEIVFDKAWEEKYIKFEFEVEFNSYITSYVNKYVCHSGQAITKFKINSKIDFTINYIHLKANPSAAFEIIDCEFYDEELVESHSNEYEIDVDVDEDLFRDR
ncbi:PIN-like domain-containing protein [Heliorestis convoluta]|uniref:PIN like domain-containing protein n=1 Tax=Heliorestis convoluta TaxID=356322 RepID=A0A5Q2MYT4_9FIRM|nr:PIN-like domain-containing protein [Heliorestis convoluta]QGG46316.1 hypothetical protein FTV88_0137 [Heliorestis convoluta]